MIKSRDSNTRYLRTEHQKLQNSKPMECSRAIIAGPAKAAPAIWPHFQLNRLALNARRHMKQLAALELAGHTIAGFDN
jgi:hypothetical protein